MAPRPNVGNHVERPSIDARKTRRAKQDNRARGGIDGPRTPARTVFTEGKPGLAGVSVRSGRGMGAVKRISYVEARPHKVLSFCW